jgi:hypothetical protein
MPQEYQIGDTLFLGDKILSEIIKRASVILTVEFKRGKR